MASWEYFIYSKSGKYSPEDIAKVLISKGYEEGINCKTTLNQNIATDSYTIFGHEIKETINIPEVKEGIMFSSGIENEENIKQIFNIFQRRDIEAKLTYKFGDIDYKEYFEDAALEVDGKTYFPQLKSEKEMMDSSLVPGRNYLNQEQFDQATKFNQRYDFYNCTFDDIKFSDNVVVGKLENCRFNRCTFENFDGKKMNLSHSTFANCKIISSNFENAYFEGADIYHSEINNSNFEMANFSTASIRNTEFKGNDLSSVLFYGATLNDVVMRDTVIQNPPEGLYLEDIYLDGATHQELEARQREIVNQLRIEPISSAYVVQQAQKQLEPLTESDGQKQHLDKLQTIAEYEQSLNVSPEERIVKMNYTTAHWQPKDNITPDQAGAVYNHITDNKRIGLERANEMRQGVGKPPLTPDAYYHNIKNMAFVTRYSFGNENSIDIEAIQSALKEVPAEYVISQMTPEQLDLYADYYESSIEFSSGLETAPSKTDTELYNNIISIRKNDAILESKIEPEINQQPNQLSKEIKQPTSKSLTKEEFDKLTSEIKDIAKTYQADPDLITDYLAFKAQFYQYSPTNTMLIHLQNPHATFVASFTKWKELGYSIKKGQHHIKISRPIEVSKFPRNVDGKTQWTNVKYASPEEKAKIANGELEIKKTTEFIPHQVFDISQTDCPVEDYPKFYNMGHPDMEQQQLYECVKEYAKECGFTVQERDLSSISLHGYYDLGDNSIHINSLLEDSERLRTMCHELAHGVLHKTSTQPVEIKEFEAECFSAMLKRKMGFPVSEESKRYIKQYYNKSNYIKNGKFDMSKTLNRLSKTFNHITKGIDNTISNMGFSQDRELAHTLSQANNKAVDVAKISENFMQALS